MSRRKVNITPKKRQAIIDAVADKPGMVPSEVRWHPAAHAVLQGEGAYLYLEEMAKQNFLYRHLRPGSKQFHYFVVPEGWTCRECDKPKSRYIAPSRDDESICARCVTKLNGGAYSESERNPMMDRWSRIPLITGGVVDMPPSRYAVQSREVVL